MELRNPTMEPMDQVIASVLEEHADLTGEAYIRQEPTQCSPKLMELSERLCRGRGIHFLNMFSGAGHDLMNWGQTVPSMLLFIPAKMESATLFVSTVRLRTCTGVPSC